MRLVLVGVIALVVGVVLGGVPQRGEVRRLEAAARAAEAERCESRVGRELASMFGRRPMMPDPPETTPEPAAEVEPQPAEVGDADPSQPRQRPPTPAESVALAKQALDIRRAQARAALVEDADPDEAQLASIDDAVDAMNGELRQIADDLVVRLEEGEPNRRDMMGFAADVLDTMITAEDRLAGALDADQRAAVDERALDPFAWVDPSLLDLLAELDR